MNSLEHIGYVSPQCDIVKIQGEEAMLAQSYFLGNGGSYLDRNDNGWF